MSANDDANHNNIGYVAFLSLSLFSLYASFWGTEQKILKKGKQTEQFGAPLPLS